MVPLRIERYISVFKITKYKQKPEVTVTVTQTNPDLANPSILISSNSRDALGPCPIFDYLSHCLRVFLGYAKCSELGGEGAASRRGKNLSRNKLVCI